MNRRLEGSAAIVTGASRGIGRAIARALAREGARLVLASRSESTLEAVACSIRHESGEAYAAPVDLSEWDQAAALFERATSALGASPSIVVLSHGHMNPMRKIHSLDREEVDRSLRTDLTSALAVLGPALEAMMAARYGRVIVVGSTLGRIGQPKSPVNSAIKSALAGLIRNLALDFGRYGVTANLVAPGFVDGERLRERSADASAHERMRRAAATGRLCTPEDVAELVAFLASPLARQITGAVIPIDGGLHIANLL